MNNDKKGVVWSKLAYVYRTSNCEHRIENIMATKIKRKGITIETKMEIIRAVNSGCKKADVGRHPQETKFEPSRKRLRTAILEDVEEALLCWFQGTRAKNLSVNGPLLREKAEQLAKMLGHTTFQTSLGWLSRFKERHSILHKQICGESDSIDQDTITSNKTMAFKGEQCHGGKQSK